MPPTRHAHRRPGILLTALVAAVALAPIGSAPGCRRRSRDPAPGRRREPPQPPGLRLPPVLAAECRDSDQLDYDLVSTIAFFGLGIKANGDIDTGLGRDDRPTSARTRPRSRTRPTPSGVRVVPTFQLFDSGSLPKMTAFLGSATAQNRFIGQALDLMERRSADGANFDFEPMPRVDDAEYLAFLGRSSTRRWTPAFPGATLVNAIVRRRAVHADHAASSRSSTSSS